MATQQDFNNLISRIDVTTTELEQAVVKVGDVAESATQAQESALQASQSAQEAIQAKDQLLAAVGYGDAPSNGIVYGRKDGEWTPVEGGGGSAGTVVSVNNVTPDAQGNVQLSYENLDNLPTLFDGDYESLTNKPALSPITTDAPNDGKQYARKNGLWSEVEGGGGGKPWENSNPNGFTFSQSYVDDIDFSLPIFMDEEEANTLYGFNTDLSVLPTNNPFTYVPLHALQLRKDGEVVFGSEFAQIVDAETGYVGLGLESTLRGVLLPTNVGGFAGADGDYIRKSLPAGKWLLMPKGQSNTLIASDAEAAGLKTEYAGGVFLLDVENLGGGDGLIKQTGYDNYPNKSIKLTVLERKPTASKPEVKRTTYHWDWNSNKAGGGKWVAK